MKIPSTDYPRPEPPKSLTKYHFGFSNLESGEHHSFNTTSFEQACIQYVQVLVDEGVLDVENCGPCG